MKNNFTKYIAYAVGEILLVVVGILIALMINSWWQDRLDSSYEKLMLEELLETVRGERENIESLNNRANNREASISQILEAIHAGNRDMDSTLRVAFTRSKYGNLLSNDPSIYESIKLRGLEKIRNDTVRKQIIVYYELVIPRGKEFINTSFGLPEQQLAYSLEKDLFILRSVKLPSGVHDISKEPVEGILQRDELLRLMDLYKGDLDYYRYRSSGLANFMDETISIIETELIRLGD